MPASAAINRPEELTERLGSGGEALLKALRDVKNQIIGNKTKKLLYLHLGAVPKIVSVLASSGDPAVVVQAAAAVGSFACGVEDGVRAVLDAGAIPHLVAILSHPDEKVVDAGARSLKMIFQSKLTPKFDVLQEKNMTFLLSLLNCDNENVTELAATIIAHSCEKNAEQKALSDAGALQRLVTLLGGSSNHKDACLESIASIIRNNTEVAIKFADMGKAWSKLTKLTQDRCPQTRLLACVCLIATGFASPCHMQEKNRLVLVLIGLLEETGRVGDDAPFALTDLIKDNEDLHKQSFSANVIEKLSNTLRQNLVTSKRLHGILLALAELSSKLEECRSQLISLQVINPLIDALNHDCEDIRIAASCCIRNISRSLKNLTAGRLSGEAIVIQLVQLLNDQSISVQIAALEAICNVSVNCTSKKSVLIQCGGVSQLVQLSRSMNSTLRLKSVWALRNLMFLADINDKEYILKELTVSTLASLICDSEHCVQEQALAFVSNLVGGCNDLVKYVYAEENVIMNAVIRHLQHSSAIEAAIQGMFLLSNISAGSETDKELVMNYLVPSQEGRGEPSFLLRFLQSKYGLLRVAAVWCIVNLTCPDSSNSSTRIARFRDAGIISLLKTMVNDSHLDCKLRVRMVLEQCMDFDSATA